MRTDLPISGLRNFGVEKSTKEWIAFVDADVEVGRDWAKTIIGFLEDQEKKGADVKKIITGSTCLVPENPTWVEQSMVRAIDVTGRLCHKIYQFRQYDPSPGTV